MISPLPIRPLGIPLIKYFDYFPYDNVFSVVYPNNIIIPKIFNPREIMRDKYNTYTECKLSEENKKSIREQMKKNVINDTTNRITVRFSYVCNEKSGENAVINYRDNIVDAVKEIKNINNDQKVIFNENEITNGKFKHEIVNKIGPLNKNWQNLRKYNKNGNDIIKIKLFLNENEYKIIPYKGELNDKYYKKLFIHNFDILPIKKIKN
jgi:hypothetical protein